MPRVKKVEKENNIQLESVMDDLEPNKNEIAKQDKNEIVEPDNKNTNEYLKEDAAQDINKEISEVIEETNQELSDSEEKSEDTEIAVAGTPITKSELEKMKKKYGKVFLSFYNDKAYIWHRLLRKDFTRICEETEDIKDTEEILSKREAEFCKICIIYPAQKEVEADIEYEMTRVKMAQEILFKSGFYSPVTQEL
jgi:hypothetical protein